MSSRKKSAAVKIALTQRAVDDLHHIERFSIREWGRKATEKYLDEIASALNRLQKSPEILRLEPDFVPGLYFYRVKKHYLVCDFQGEVVTILTIIHTSMDVPARLLELEPRLAAEVQFLQSKLRETPERQ
ncbi:MAG: type II toxin-antitoxin system RelE/ParE family toxin [Planctomycetaceae bacterium]